jgi:uncharacterized membrane protein
VSFDDWMLALHVLSAFSLVAGLIVYWVIIVAVRRTDSPEQMLRMGPVAGVARATIGIGALGTLVPGIWLALSYGGYELWDGWIIAGLVLWVITMGLDDRTRAAYAHGVRKARELQTSGQLGPSAELLTLNRTTRGLVLQTAATIGVLLILVDMIWKPGA